MVYLSADCYCFSQKYILFFLKKNKQISLISVCQTPMLMSQQLGISNKSKQGTKALSELGHALFSLKFIYRSSLNICERLRQIPAVVRREFETQDLGWTYRCQYRQDQHLSPPPHTHTYVLSRWHKIVCFLLGTLLWKQHQTIIYKHWTCVYIIQHGYICTPVMSIFEYCKSILLSNKTTICMYKQSTEDSLLLIFMYCKFKSK